MRKWVLSEVRSQLDNEEPALISQSRYYMLEVFEEDSGIEFGEKYGIDRCIGLDTCIHTSITHMK